MGRVCAADLSEKGGRLDPGAERSDPAPDCGPGRGSGGDWRVDLPAGRDAQEPREEPRLSRHVWTDTAVAATRPGGAGSPGCFVPGDRDGGIGSNRECGPPKGGRAPGGDGRTGAADGEGAVRNTSREETTPKKDCRVRMGIQSRRRCSRDHRSSRQAAEHGAAYRPEAGRRVAGMMSRRRDEERRRLSRSPSRRSH